MSPQITWRNGGPLMLPGNVVGGSAKCCCENPPPPDCLCPDFCSYKLKITSPISLATDFTCTQSLKALHLGAVVNQNPTPHPLTLPGFTKGSETCLARPELYVVGQGAPLIRGRIEYNGTFSKYVVIDNSYSYSILASYTVRYELRVTCSKPSSIQAAAYNVRLTRLISCEARPMGLWDPRVLRQSSVYVDLPLTRYCARNDNAWCRIPYSYRGLQFAFLNQQSIELPGNSISWTNEFQPLLIDTSYGAFGGLMRDAVDTMYDHCIAAPVTFSIAARSSCKAVPCEPLSIDGLVVRFGGFDFTIGTPNVQSASNDPYLDVFEYFGGAGTAASPHLFTFTRYDLASSNFVYEMQNLELWTAQDTSVTPPVDRWYLLQTTDCFVRDQNNAVLDWSFDKWTGHFECYDAECDSVDVASGQAVPLDEPSMERDPGHPIVISGNGCEPPPLKTFSIRQACGG